MEKMTHDLLEQIKQSISDTVNTKKIGIAFSGGVDSTLISKICSDLNYDVTLLTIGFKDSHDINFAKNVNESLKFKHHILEIIPNDFLEISNKIKSIIKTDNLSWIENSIAFYHVSKLAQSLKINTVVTANGIDELFCGYNSYRNVFDDGADSLLNLMNSKLENEKNMMNAISQVVSEFNVTLIQPLLSENFIAFAKTIPFSEKITNKDDLMRKHIIRRLALEYGIPELSANARKKALQYGTLIHKALIKSR